MLKEEARKQYLQKRKNILANEKLILDDLLLIQFQKLFLHDFSTVLTFWPIEKFNEPNSLYITSYLRHFTNNLRIAYPKTNFNDNTMSAIMIDENTVYTTNEYGITEPKFGELLSPTLIDVVLVPLVICDKKGNRVGYGKGFYDRYLKQCSNDVAKIGIGYFEPINQLFDVNENDIKLDLYITPKAVYEFE
jgi:5-formyltetrahydrofolate cyclo-ligase